MTHNQPAAFSVFAPRPAPAAPELRAAISAATPRAEPEAPAPLLRAARMTPNQDGAVDALALRLAGTLRARKGARCRIPDDYIDEKRYPLFMDRAVLKELIESLQSTGSVSS